MSNSSTNGHKELLGDAYPLAPSTSSTASEPSSSSQATAAVGASTTTARNGGSFDSLDRVGVLRLPATSAGSSKDDEAGTSAEGTSADAKDEFSRERLKIGKKLGEGCFASVYLVTDRKSGNAYALKTINLPAIKDKSMRDASRNEFRLLTSIERHENVVHCFGYFEEKNGLVINLVLEYVDGGDLEDYIRRYPLKHKSLLPERMIWFLFRQTTDGIRFLHENRILHRDLKPANVLLTRKNVAKITDLGLSRVKAQTGTGVGAKTVCGTPYYLSPERMSEKAYSFKADVWSLGCILYEMAALRCPFYGETSNEYSLKEKIREAYYPPIPHDCYSAQLNRVVDACLTPDPAKRPTAATLLSVARHMEELFGNDNGIRISTPRRMRNVFASFRL